MECKQTREGGDNPSRALPCTPRRQLDETQAAEAVTCGCSEPSCFAAAATNPRAHHHDAHTQTQRLYPTFARRGTTGHGHQSNSNSRVQLQRRANESVTVRHSAWNGRRATGGLRQQPPSTTTNATQTHPCPTFTRCGSRRSRSPQHQRTNANENVNVAVRHSDSSSPPHAVLPYLRRPTLALRGSRHSRCGWRDDLQQHQQHQ